MGTLEVREHMRRGWGGVGSAADPASIYIYGKDHPCGPDQPPFSFKQLVIKYVWYHFEWMFLHMVEWLNPVSSWCLAACV